MNKNGRSLLTKSTRELYKEGKNTEDYTLYDFLHGYSYIKWPYLYIGVALGEHKLSKILQPLFLFLSKVLTPFRMITWQMEVKTGQIPITGKLSRLMRQNVW